MKFNDEAIFGDVAAVTITKIPRVAVPLPSTGVTPSPARAPGNQFVVTGTLARRTLGELQDAEERILAYADGEAYELVDSEERTWPGVRFLGEYSTGDSDPRVREDGSWVLAYRLVLLQTT